MILFPKDSHAKAANPTRLQSRIGGVTSIRGSQAADRALKSNIQRRRLKASNA
jgi:hypothetical protein